MDGLNPSRAASPIFDARRARRLGKRRKPRQDGERGRAFFVEGEEVEPAPRSEDARPRTSSPSTRHQGTDGDEDTGRHIDVTA